MKHDACDEQQAEAACLEAAIARKLEELGYGG